MKNRTKISMNNSKQDNFYHSFDESDSKCPYVQDYVSSLGKTMYDLFQMLKLSLRFPLRALSNVWKTRSNDKNVCWRLKLCRYWRKCSSSQHWFTWKFFPFAFRQKNPNPHHFSITIYINDSAKIDLWPNELESNWKKIMISLNTILPKKFHWNFFKLFSEKIKFLVCKIDLRGTFSWLSSTFWVI